MMAKRKRNKDLPPIPTDAAIVTVLKNMLTETFPDINVLSLKIAHETAGYDRVGLQVSCGINTENQLWKWLLSHAHIIAPAKTFDALFDDRFEFMVNREWAHSLYYDQMEAKK